MISKIDRFPVIILSSPRTGSTLLAEMLSKKLPDCKLYLEPVERLNKNIMDNFVKYSNSNDQYILKLHLKNLNNYSNDIINKINNRDAFLIRIRRKDVVAQMASLYIAKLRDIWYYNSTKIEQYKEESMSVNMDMVKNIIIATKKNNSILENSTIPYDLEIYYEDLIKELSEGLKTFTTPKPINYTEIYQAIKKELKAST
jgi:hypothetical protein